MQTAPISLQRPIDPEDRVRADLYAVLARLFADAPDAAFLAALGDAEPLEEAGDGTFARAWRRLVEASRAMDADAAKAEYDALFIGVGKSEVNLHASHWLAGFMMEKPLADLRTELSALGLARKDAATMVEDHLAALFETMRLLITGDETRRPSAIGVQRNFFQKRLLPWIFDCCAAIERSSLANYYLRVAEFTCLFMMVERDSLVME